MTCAYSFKAVVDTRERVLGQVDVCFEHVLQFL